MSHSPVCPMYIAAELRRLRRVVRAAERFCLETDKRDDTIGQYIRDHAGMGDPLSDLYDAVAAYRKGKKK